MKNYPFADARVRREAEKNVGFRQYLSERTTTEITRRRDIVSNMNGSIQLGEVMSAPFLSKLTLEESVFLSRPVTRLPRVMLLIEALEKCTPADHPDRDELPMVHEVLNNVVKASQVSEGMINAQSQRSERGPGRNRYISCDADVEKPGIESAEAKIKLWNIAERLLFKRGEIIVRTAAASV